MKRVNCSSPPIITNVFREGIYNLTEIEALLKDKIYKAQNVSDSKNAHIIILDNNLFVLQSIKLMPESIQYNLTPLKSSYKVIIIGDADVYIS